MSGYFVTATGMEAGHLGRLWSLEGLMWLVTAVIPQHGHIRAQRGGTCTVQSGTQEKG